MESLAKSLHPIKELCNPKQGLTQPLLIKYSQTGALPFSQIISTANGQNKLGNALISIADNGPTRHKGIKNESRY